MTCPLCESENISILETINKDDLVSLYKRLTKKNFHYLITKDIDFCFCNTCQLKFFFPMISGDEAFYNSLQKFDWYYMDEKNEFDYALQHIKESDTVLEIGCGKGAFAKLIPNNTYIGLDFSENAKSLAAKNGIHIENKSIQDYSRIHPLEFDVVISFQVLEHVSDPKNFLEAQLNALKKQGKLIIAVPSEDSFLQFATNNFLNMPPHHLTRWSDQTFYFIAKKYNLKILQIHHEKVQAYHKKWYIHTWIQNVLTTKRLINVSFLYKISNIFISIIAKLFLKKLHDVFLPNGHTVLVVLEKQ